MRPEFFYISNIISYSRFILTAVCAYFLLSNNYTAGCIMIIIIWISDLLDGYAARSRNEISDLGKLIDPAADKTAIMVISAILAAKGFVPVWFIIIVFIRDLIILSGGLYLKKTKNVILQSNRIGKAAVFIIGLTLLVYLFINSNIVSYFSYHGEFTELLLFVLLLLSLVMIVFSIVSYFIRYLNEIKRN